MRRTFQRAWHFASAVIVFATAGTALLIGQTGLQQSPIDIRIDELVERNLPELNLRYPTSTSLQVRGVLLNDENGTVRADVPVGAASLRVQGRTYNLLQFHIHVPGEHELNGRQFPGELHLVHQEQGATGTNGLLVVGRWLVVRRSGNRELAKYFAALPHDIFDTEVRRVARFNLTRLLPSDDDDDDLETFRYDGSLTAGAVEPFPEGVKWIVLRTAMAVTQPQLEAFAHLFADGNAREVQPLNGRVVRSDDRN